MGVYINSDVTIVVEISKYLISLEKMIHKKSQAN